MNVMRFFLSYLLASAIFISIATGNLFAESYYVQGKQAFAARNYEKAHQHFQEALRVNPGNGDPYFYIGYMLEYEDKRDDAVEAYRRGVALRMDPELREKALWKIILHYKYTRNWTGLIYYAEIFLKYRDDPEVRKLLDSARQNQDPRIPRIQSLLRSALEKENTGDFQAAMQDYKTALSLDPELESAHWRIALIYIKREENTSAESHLETLTTLNPDSWEYHYKYSLVLYRLGKYEAARRELEKSLSSNKNQADTYKYYTSILGGLIDLEFQNWESARKRLEPWIAKKNALVYGALSRSYIGLEERSKAMEQVRLALQIDANQSEALLVDYILSLQAKNRHESIVRFRHFLQTFPESFPGDRVIPESFQRAAVSGSMILLTEEPEKALASLNNLTETIRHLPEAQLPEDGSVAPYSTNLFAFPPRKEDVLLTLARYHTRKGNQGLAQKAMSDLSDSPWKNYDLALMYASDGQIVPAKFALMRAIQTSPELRPYAEKESVFRDLAEKDQDFSRYLFPNQFVEEKPASIGSSASVPQTQNQELKGPENPSAKEDRTESSEPSTKQE